MATTLGSIKVEEIPDLESILDFSFIQCANEHPVAHLRAIIKEDVSLSQYHTMGQDTVIHIVSDHDTSTKRLFTGYIQSIATNKSIEGYWELDLALVGVSVKLNQAKKSRSFQKVSETHEDIIKKVASEQSATISWNAQAANAIGIPVIQYSETNWEFALRMASIYHSSVIVNEKSDKPMLEIGLGKTSSEKEISASDFGVGISPRFYQLGGAKAGYKKSSFIYYEVEDTQDLSVGEMITFQDDSYVVLSKRGTMKDNRLVYTYQLGSEESVKVRTIYNDRFVGRTILGKVIKTEAETLKLSLNLEDDEHKDEDAYAYNWTPETGNLMYCMPQVGTTVSLYFPDNLESSGTVVNCIRVAQSGSPKLNNPSNKNFTSEHGMAMDMELGDFRFATSEDAPFSKLGLLDSTDISFETEGAFHLLANHKVVLKGKNIEIEVPSGTISLLGSTGESIASMLMNYEFDILGTYTVMEATGGY